MATSATDLASRWGFVGLQMGMHWEQFLEDLTFAKFEVRCLDVARTDSDFYGVVYETDIFQLELSVVFVMCVSYFLFLFSFSLFFLGGRGGVY